MFMVWQSGFVGKYIFVKIPKDNSGLILEKMKVMENLEELNAEFIKAMKDNHENKEFQDFLIEYLDGYAKSLQLLHKQDDFKLTRFIYNFKQTYAAWREYKHNMAHLKKHQIAWIRATVSGKSGGLFQSS